MYLFESFLNILMERCVRWY